MDVPNDETSVLARQQFVVASDLETTSRRLSRYFHAAGAVNRSLRGTFEEVEPDVFLHDGRICTTATLTEQPDGTQVTLHRKGRPLFETTKGIIALLAITGFSLAWLLSWYNSRAEDALSPLITGVLFFMGLVAMVVIVYIVDRLLAYQSRRLIRGLEEALQGDWRVVLRREIRSLDRVAAFANALLAYAIALILLAVAFTIVWSPGVRDQIDGEVALDVMRTVFALALAPAIITGAVAFLFGRMRHAERLVDVLEQLPPVH